ncbi:MAG: phage major capsid protein [Methanobrevibacter sp.]|nr:phage major capsid protein [Methanobrevibacter sp.]
MRKAILEKKLARLMEKQKALSARALASEDANEVRSINETLSEVNAEIEETRDEISAIDAEMRDVVPANAELRNGAIVGAFTAKSEGTEAREDNYFESVEYRKAFMKFVQTGEPIMRAGEAISTGDTGAAIPVTIMNDVINTVRKRYGNLYNKVRKLSVQGGVDFPIGALSAKFKWINEKTVSPRQRVGDTDKISFKFNTAEIRVAQTFLSQIVTLSSFESKLAEVIAIAYLQAMDEGIVVGSGDGSMLGILNDPRVTNSITMTASDMNDWKAWRKNFFAKLPLGYRAGEFIFPLSTVETYLETMSDANNNPVFRQATGLEVNDGDAVNPNGRFFGRDISLVEPDIIADFDSASAGDVIGVFWQPEEYAINENFGFTMRRYFDEETNEWVDKALVVVDGKVLNPKGIYLIKKG